jgi:CDGSH-type Zn-finger protein
MAQPTIAQKAPIVVEVEAGRIYWWCRCGRSATQPFCDGSHKGSEFAPLEWRADVAEKKWFCACKQTGKQPFCDGTHKKL